MAVFVLGPGIQSWIRDWKNEILKVKKNNNKYSGGKEKLHKD